MHTLVAALVTTLSVLGIWTAISLAAAVPLVLWFRAQARRNALRTRDERRKAWEAATDDRATAR